MKSDKNFETTLILAIVGGMLGLHRFYVGKFATGLLMLFTNGLFGIMYVFDIVSIIGGKFKDSKGRYISSNYNYRKYENNKFVIVKDEKNNNDSSDIVEDNKICNGNFTIIKYKKNDNDNSDIVEDNKIDNDNSVILEDKEIDEYFDNIEGAIKYK